MSAQKDPVRVVVTGAAGQIAYSLVFRIGAGEMLGSDCPIDLILFDLPMMLDKLKAVRMELMDCAFPLVRSITVTSELEEAFEDVQLALLVGAKPRGKGMERSDLLHDNCGIFKQQGQALDKYADKKVKVVVVGNPANTNALVAMRHAPSIPRENFTAMTRLDMNRAVAQIADKANVNVCQISDVFVWGNHSSTQYPDTRQGYVTKEDGTKILVKDAVADDTWLSDTFLKTVQQRGKAVIDLRGASSAGSAANALIDHVRDWWCGSNGRIVSMGIVSDTNPYGISDDLIFSFPVTCHQGTWKIVDTVNIDDVARERLRATESELLDEKSQAMA